MVFLFFSLFFLFFFSLKKGGDILKNKRNFSVEKIHEKCLFFLSKKNGILGKPLYLGFICGYFKFTESYSFFRILIIYKRAGHSL